MITTSDKKNDVFVQFTSRFHLTPEQKIQIKQAFDEKARMETISPVGSNGSLRVTTTYRPKIEEELRMPRITLVSLLQSNESLAMPLVLTIQRVLGVPLVSKKLLEEHFKSYVSHLTEHYELPVK